MYLNNSQTSVFATFLFGLMLFVACSKKSNSLIHANTTHDLKLGEQVSFGNKKDNIKITLDKLSDSRCPINARCVRAGNVVVNLVYENSLLKTQNTTFTIGESSNFNPDTVELKINKDKYRIILESVLPQPEIGKTEVQTATFHFYKL